MTIRLTPARLLTLCVAVLSMTPASIAASLLSRRPVRPVVLQTASLSSDDALLDVLVFTPQLDLDSHAYPVALRSELDGYLARARRDLRPGPAQPTGLDRLVRQARTLYAARLVGVGGDGATALAAAYVEALKPCYEWEGLHECPEREAIFADAYQADHADGPFRHYLPLLSAHRWLCAAEGYEHEKKADQVLRARRQHDDRLVVALRSDSALIRAAARQLEVRAACRGRS